MFSLFKKISLQEKIDDLVIWIDTLPNKNERYSSSLSVQKVEECYKIVQEHVKRHNDANPEQMKLIKKIGDSITVKTL